MPCAANRCWVASLEGTAASKVCRILANSSMKQLAVEPVPTPTMLLRSSLGAMYEMAASAAFCLSSS